MKAFKSFLLLALAMGAITLGSEAWSKETGSFNPPVTVGIGESCPPGYAPLTAAYEYINGRWVLVGTVCESIYRNRQAE